MVEKSPVSSFAKFRESKVSTIIGIVLAAAVGVLLFYAGMVEKCCVGTLLIGAVAFMVLKIFGVKDIKMLIVAGVVFLLVTTAFGGLVVSKSSIDSYANDFNSNGFNDMKFTYENGEVAATVTYSGEKTLDSVDLYFGEVSYICYRSFNYYGYNGDSSYKHTMENVAGTNTYTCHFNANSEKLYGYKITAKSGDTTFSTYNGICKALISDSNYMIELVKLNSYYCALATLLLMAIILFTEWSNRNLEKTKQKMIAEGRIPAGYGTCKNCGGLIVPGEQFCRKCGEKIDTVVPIAKEEPQADAQEYFECSDCGAKVPADAKVCPKCGAKFDEDEDETSMTAQNTATVKCPRCGADMPGDTDMCPACGKKIDKN